MKTKTKKRVNKKFLTSIHIVKQIWEDKVLYSVELRMPNGTCSFSGVKSLAAAKALAKKFTFKPASKSKIEICDFTKMDDLLTFKEAA